MADELEELFPNLTPVLRGMAGNAGHRTGDTSDEHGGVTDSDIEAYFATRQTGTPRFQSGVGAPPPVGGMEDEVANSTTSQTPQPVPATGPNADPSSPPNQPAETTPPFQAPAPDDPNRTTPPDDNQENETGGGSGASSTEGRDADGLIDLGNGRRISRELVEAYEQFNQRLSTDPTLQQIIQSYIETGTVPPSPGPAQGAAAAPAQSAAPSAPSTPPAPSSPFDTPPPDLDLDDPAIKAIWNANKTAYEQQQAFLAQQQEILSTVTATIQAQQQRDLERANEQNQAIIDQAVSSFKTAKNLSDEDMTKLRTIAGRMNVLPAIINSGVDPITGQTISRDPRAAVERSLEIAYYTDPDYRAREWQAQVQQQKADGKRKAKAGALSGSSGSVPRSQPAPTTPEGQRAAMIGEVAQMLNGSWSQG